MSSEAVVVDVRSVSKRYEIYATPRDRLKQFLLPRVLRASNRIGVALGLQSARSEPAYFREFWALKNVSFSVRSGETLGIVGRNGGGKSTLLQIIAGTMTPTSGQVEVSGRVAALLELGSGFNPDFSGRENVFLNGRLLGLSQREIEERYRKIVEFAEIGDFIDEPVKTYSSGMFLRLAFAVQAHVDAKVVIIDEALAVGDVFFRQKCYEHLEKLRRSGAAIILVSHAMTDIEQYCEHAIVLDRGEVRFSGSSAEATKHYYLIHQKQAVEPASRYGRSERQAPDLDLLRRLDEPSAEAFFDITNKAQIENGQAHCVAVALCDESGEPRNSFRQGDLAVFYYVFELRDRLDVPVCGLTITNERGVIVHGKNSLQTPGEVPVGCEAGDRVVCRQEVRLDVAPGEYVFQVGLGWLRRDDWDNRCRFSYDEQERRVVRACHVPQVGAFSVGVAIKDNNLSFLTHHGIANLSGSTEIAVNARPVVGGVSCEI